MIEIESAEKHISGFNIIDCDIISPTHFGFTLREDYTQWPNWGEGSKAPKELKLKKRILELDLTKPEGEKWTSFGIENFDLLNTCSKSSSNSYIGMAKNFDGFEVSFGELQHTYDVLPNILNDGIRRGTLKKAKFFNNNLIACTSSRQLLTLNDDRQWSVIGDQIPANEDWAISSFSDFDLFSLDDIYAVGGKGEVWHYNGHVWLQMDFPTNHYTHTVCCGGDGSVYITVDSATIYKGRGNEWELIHEEVISLTLKDAVWYEDKMWCTNDFGIWVLDNGKFERQEDLPTGALVSAGYLAQRDGVLLVAGFYGAAYKKDDEWVQAISQQKVHDLMKGQ